MRVCLIGNLVGYAYTITKFLRARGMEAELLLSRHEVGIEAPQWEDRELLQMPEWIRCWDRIGGVEFLAPKDGTRECGSHLALSSLNLLRLLRQYDVVLSFATLSIYSSFCGRPYIACANGSDLRELAQQSSVKGRLMRRAYHKASKIVLWNLDHLKVADRTGLKGARFVPFAIDLSQYSPGDTGIVSHLRGGDGLLFFHPSHLDWSYKGSDRNSTKGNDRFIRAFARFVREGNKARLVMLDRGVDRQLTRELIADLGISPEVTLLPELDRTDLLKWYRVADVVADQFDIGSFGTTALEAMACEKPVLIYIDETSAKSGYGEVPPVLNARSEEEIYRQMLSIRDAELRAQVGERSRRFVNEHHDWRKVTDRLTEDLWQVSGCAR